MDNQQEKELFELNKDLSGTQNQSSEFSELENQLSQHKNFNAPSYLKNTIMAKSRRPSPIIQVLLPMAAALFFILLGGILFYLNVKAKPEATKFILKPETTITNVANILEKELGVNAPKPQKYYALYYSSALCKPCIDMLAELNNFYIDQKAKNPDFEIIYIELDKHIYIDNNLAALQFKKVEFNDLHDKEFFKQFKEGHGPSFVVLDNQGNVITKHQKNMHQKSTHPNTFNTVLTAFSDLLAKS